MYIQKGNLTTHIDIHNSCISYDISFHIHKPMYNTSKTHGQTNISQSQGKKKHKQQTHTETNNDTDSPATNGAPPFSHAQRQTHPSQPQIHKILTKCKAKELATPGRERTSGRAWQSGLAQTRVVPVDAVLEIYMKMTLNTKSQTVA